MVEINTYDEAVDAVLKHSNIFGFPMCDDAYRKAGFDLERLFSIMDTNGKLTKSIEKNHTKKYASINIEVIRTLYHREGKKLNWEISDYLRWKKNKFFSKRSE